jgi:signal recognition particle subunit SRP68
MHLHCSCGCSRALLYSTLVREKNPYIVSLSSLFSQHIVELDDIAGLEDNLVAQKEKAARTFAFKAFRCFHLAESYVAMQRWAESIGLFDRAQEHVTEALEHYRDLEQEPGDTATEIEGVNYVTIIIIL